MGLYWGRVIIIFTDTEVRNEKVWRPLAQQIVLCSKTF
jgi:hypothetical protein